MRVLHKYDPILPTEKTTVLVSLISNFLINANKWSAKKKYLLAVIRFSYLYFAVHNMQHISHSVVISKKWKFMH